MGDEIMVAGAARAHHARTGRKVRIVHFAHRPLRWMDIWNGLPYIAQPGEQGDFGELAAKDQYGLRAYIVTKNGEHWTWRAFKPDVAEIVFTPAEVGFGTQAAGTVMLEPNIKPAASPNKDWGWAHWQRLVELRPDIRWLQAGAPGVRELRGVRRVVTSGFRLAAALLSKASAAVLSEGGLHHAAAAVGTPAVVIRGGFISPEVTGYAGQRDLYVEDPRFPLGCGMRVPCKHCADAMVSITPEQVAKKLAEVL